MHELVQWALHVVQLSALYTNQSTALYQSSLPTIDRVNAAIQRANSLELVVRQIQANSTYVLAQTAHARKTAMAAVAQAVWVKRKAQEMLNIVNNFGNISTLSQRAAQEALSKVQDIQSISETAIRNSTAVQRAIESPHALAQQALLRSNRAKNLSMQEPKVRHTCCHVTTI